MLRSAGRAELIQHAFELAQQVVVGDHVDNVFSLASVHLEVGLVLIVN
jgi:hypothetical protein